MAGGSSEAPYFFFSYVRKDDPELMEQFFTDLSREVAAVTTREEEDAGFRDAVDIGLGKSWRPELAHALRTCECFVPIITPRFLVHPFCGQEWQAFQSRLELSSPPPAGKPSRLLPVLWRPLPEKYPQVISDHQYTHGSFGQTYIENGLVTLLKVTEYRDEYQKFLMKFASMMLQAVSASRLPPSENDFDFSTLPNAFDPGAMELSPSMPSQSGADHALVVIAAGAESDMKSIRSEISSYGQGWRNWRPFPPPSVETAVVLTQSILAGEGLASTPVAFDDALIERIKESPESDIFLIFLDPWSVSLPKFEQRLNWLDKRRFLGAVLKVWSKDAETETNSDVMRARIQAALPLLTATGTATSLFDVPADHERFSQQLEELIATMQGRMFATRPDQRRVHEQVDQVAPPLIQGPTG